MTRQFLLSLLSIFSVCLLISCESKSTADISTTTSDSNDDGIRIAYVNGDSILYNFKEFKAESDMMEQRQRKAEAELQKKGEALEREIRAYQQQAQQGTLTGKEMEAREKYLSQRQEAILAERDKVAKEILDETAVINERLEKVIHGILEDIKEKEGYDFILSYIKGGPILIADQQYDITDRVLELLNKSESAPKDTSSNK